MTALFPADPPLSVPVAGSDRVYPVRRIFCVGRNYEKHAAEMGARVDRDAPWYFTKTPANGILSGAMMAYPKGTENFHHEMELAVYLDEQADPLGFGCALDMTRRDRQQDGKDNRRPWSLGKDVEGGTVLAPLVLGWTAPDAARIWLEVNGARKQDAALSDMVWSVPEIIGHLGRYYDLGAGDVILTGTPEGVGPVAPGDTLNGGIDGLAPIALSIGAPAPRGV